MNEQASQKFKNYFSKPLILISVALIGIRSLHWLMLRGSHDFVHGDLGDSRLVHLILEHGWLFISGSKFLEEGFWTAPWNFYPVLNSMLMSDLMGAATWNYSIFRAFGIDPDPSYQLWFVSTSLANFLSAYFLARTIRIGFWGSLASGWLFAFSIVRGAFIAHPQLMPHYFSVIALMFGVLACRSKAKIGRSMLLGALSGFCLSLQFWTAFYLVWFSIFTTILATILALVVWRSLLIREIKKSLVALLSFNASFLLFSTTLAVKYLSMQSVVGSRKWSEITAFLPGIRALFLPSPDAWIYHWLFEKNFDVSPWYSEMFMFPGAVAIGCVLLCMWRVYRRSLGVAEFSAILWILLMVSVQYDLWKGIFYSVPGASAIRAVGRISLAGLIPLSLCVGSMVDEFYLAFERVKNSRWCGFFGAALISIVMIDTGITPNFGYSQRESQARIETVKNSLSGRSCRVFHFGSQDTPWKVNIDAMWASILSSTPTVNGYSGHIPPGYIEAGLSDGMNVNSEHVKKWLELHNVNLDSSEICIAKFKAE